MCNIALVEQGDRGSDPGCAVGYGRTKQTSAYDDQFFCLHGALLI